MRYIEKRNETMEGNLQKYMSFVKTVEVGSFTRAAGILNYAQSTVSKMIADLEKEWKMTLLERDRNGLRLTADGRELFPFARKLVEDFERMQVHADELKGIRSGVIRIGTFSSVATHWMPKIIQAFGKKYPKIEYELLTGDYDEIESWIMEGRVECGFLRLPVRKEFETIELKTDELKVVLPKGHPLAEREMIPIEKLEHQPFMLLEHGGKTEVSELLEQYDVNPEILFTTWDDYAIMSMVESGLGIGILPELILKRIPYEIEVRGLDVPAFRRIGLVCRNKKSLSAAAGTFWEYLNRGECEK